ncbi:DUF4174 domain-containing protein [Congregibacter variabilis]|uniref:DUF4174 domain-containing protein n=1 Tax=Congregibacter variabilis TaxID=3081200 RepID=A0ABZ0I065_9GAMM|nr:DUF4174 domain-containing protein [Congregibacter sp. IMCC43200]
MISDLDDLRWQHRILLINEPQDTDALLALLSAGAAALEERRLIWFVLQGGTVQTNSVQALGNDLATNAQLQLDVGPNEVLLIGLDGGVKARGSELDLDALYALIDAMPMRRAEQRE